MKKYNKIVIAEEYLEGAVDAYFAGEYFTAHHLASAAEEIFEGFISARNHEDKNLDDGNSPFIADEKTTILQDIHSHMGNYPKRDFWTIIHRTKNKIKHVFDLSRTRFELEVEVNIERDATFSLARAIFNYRKLGYSPRDRTLDFFLKFNRGEYQHFAQA